ncbi:MAG: transmembrane(s)protein [candidate division WS6 bacterium 34_10]|uniref:Transmembrane(S)protein n=1 Tax=candidate division WS6 bacterium 34_10 TaxID=1641389 RepID=A0A117LZP6_9BACT|nr:MAG: transmembrane(s)protein [candidate division WS6 bacterium 34_10]
MPKEKDVKKVNPEEKNEFDKLLDIVSGEKTLREKQEKIKKAKIEAKKAQKQKRREEIVNEEVKLEEDVVPKQKVVQNIKLFEWTAPDRTPVKFEKRSFLIVIVMTLLFSLYLAIMKHYLLMVAIMSVLFLLYVAGTTKPVKITHKITARGIDTGAKLYEWFMLKNFYFTKKDDQILLLVETNLNFPGVLTFLVNDKDKDPIFVLLQDKLLYKDIRKWKWLDKLSYGEYIPLEEV